MAVGMVRLVQALQARMLAARTPAEVCSLFLDLFLPLFDAQGMRIALSERARRHGLEGVPSQGLQAGEFHGMRRMSVALRGEDASFGDIELYFPEGHPALDPPNHALLDFAAAHLSSVIAARLSADAMLERLTRTERRVLVHLNRPTALILDEFGISEATFRTHLRHLYGKLGVSSRQEALSWIADHHEALSWVQA